MHYKSGYGRIATTAERGETETAGRKEGIIVGTLQQTYWYNMKDVSFAVALILLELCTY